MRNTLWKFINFDQGFQQAYKLNRSETKTILFLKYRLSDGIYKSASFLSN